MCGICIIMTVYGIRICILYFQWSGSAKGKSKLVSEMYCSLLCCILKDENKWLLNVKIYLPDWSHCSCGIWDCSEAAWKTLLCWQSECIGGTLCQYTSGFVPCNAVKGVLWTSCIFFLSVIIYVLDYHMKNECGFLVEVLKPIHQKTSFFLQMWLL